MTTIKEELALMAGDCSEEELEMAELEMAYALESGCQCRECAALRRMGFGSSVLLDLS
jgi:hypothetical protein